MSIRFKFIYIFLTVTIIPMLFAGFLIFNNTEHSIKRIVFKNIDQTQQTRVSSIQSYLDQMSHKVELVSKYPPIQGIIRSTPTGTDPKDQSTLEQWKKRLQSIFSSSITSNPQILQMRYLNEQGMELIRVNAKQGQPVIIADDQLQNKQSSFYFQEALRLNPDQVYISSIELNQEHEKIEKPFTPVIRFAKPIVSELDGSKKGIVILNIDADQMLQATLGNIGETDLIIFDQKGQFLFHPTNSEKEFGEILGTEHNYFLEQPELGINVQKYEFKWHEDYEEQEYRLWRKIHYNPHHHDHYWVVLERIKQEQIFAPIISILKATWIIGLITFLVVIGVALMTANSVSKPLLLLSDEAKKIMQGNLQFSIKDDFKESKDEVGTLAQSLNLMTDKLIKSNINLEQRVKERTQELEQTVQELEQFNNIAMGREERIIELKQKINVLSKELGKQAPYCLDEIESEEG